MSPPRSLAETVAFGRRAAAVQAGKPAGRGVGAVALVLAGGIASGCLAMGIHRLRPEPPRIVTVELGRETLAIPSQIMRGPSRADGPAGRVDLAVGWPSLGPPGPGEDAVETVGTAGAKGLGNVLLVTLLPADDGPAPETRPATVYARFLTPMAATRPDGLVARRFRDGTAYAGEDLFLSAPDGRRFSARCEAPEHYGNALPNLCLTEFRRGQLDIRVRFEPRLLPEWEALESRITAFVEALARPAPTP